MQARTWRPSPALVIAIIALVRSAYRHRLGGPGQEQRRLQAAQVEGRDHRQDRQQRGHRRQGRLELADRRRHQHRPAAARFRAPPTRRPRQDAKTVGGHAAECPGGLDPDQGRLLRPRAQPGRRRRQSRGQRLRREGRLPADADGALLRPQRDQPRHRRRPRLRGRRRVLREHGGRQLPDGDGRRRRQNRGVRRSKRTPSTSAPTSWFAR